MTRDRNSTHGAPGLQARGHQWRLAAGAAVRFARQHGIVRAVRLGIAGLLTLGPRGLLRRAAADTRQAEDDARYRAWLPSHTPTPAGLDTLRREVTAWPSRPLISVVTPVFNTPAVWLRRCIESVRAQVYPEWELCLCDDGSTNAEAMAILASLADDPKIRVVRSPVNGGIVHASNAALALAGGEFVGFLDHDDELAPDALAEVARRLIAEPDLDVVYTDEDKMDDRGVRGQPHFKPDWSPELLRSCMYVSHFTVIRRTLVQAAGAFRSGTEGAQDYDLLLRVSARSPRVAHAPKVLYHWRMTEASAANSQLGKPWAVAAGQRALDDDVRRRGQTATVTTAGAAGHYRVRYEVREVDYLLFLEPNIRPPSRDALNALLELCQQDDIGAVGGIVLFPDGTIDSAGLVLGADGAPMPAFRGEPSWTRGHLSNIVDVRNCAAVSRACLMTRRSVFEQVGGKDESAGALWDVDYCLRVRRAGLRIAVTPHARIHRTDMAPSPAPTPQEFARLRARWGTELDGDPYYNPNFNQRAATFRLPESPRA